MHLLMVCTTAVCMALQINETHVSGEKEGKAPSVPVSPIYSSPIKSKKVQNPSVNTTWIVPYMCPLVDIHTYIH